MKAFHSIVYTIYIFNTFTLKNKKNIFLFTDDKLEYQNSAQTYVHL